MAYAHIETWKPHAKSADTLNRAMEHIQSVPYKVSVRWVFYRLLQDGIYAKKSHYAGFVALTSRARHAGWNGWHPTLLADETREMTIYAGGGREPDPDIGWLVADGVEQARSDLEYYREQLKSYRYRSDYSVDPSFLHDYIVVVMYEARAMSQQFRAYAKGVTLCPFGGQPSIPYKFEIAQYLSREHDRYGKPVKVLYFGDLDEQGREIFETGKADISKWCRAELDFTWCGLTEEHVRKYQVPENIEHEGYQWEALTDEQAAEIIHEGMAPYYDFGANRRAQELSATIQNRVEAAVNERIELGE